MKRSLAAVLVLVPLTLPAFAEQMVPAGSIIRCTVAEPKISSKTTAIGDPVLCQISHVELYGRSSFPYDSYLIGTFQEYKDPGHFVGKGWMELKFDRMVTRNDTIIPLNVRVVDVPGYPVDLQGRIHGNGHPVRDIVEWSIPILWPIDLINLPRRGPRPVLKAETRLTLKVLDDFGIPSQQEVEHKQALISRIPEQEYSPSVDGPRAPAPIQQAYRQAPPPQPVYQQQPAYQQPIQQAYSAPPQTVIYQNFAPQQPVYQQPPTVVVHAPPVVVQEPPVVYHYPAPVVYGPYGPMVYRGYYGGY